MLELISGGLLIGGSLFWWATRAHRKRKQYEAERLSEADWEVIRQEVPIIQVLPKKFHREFERNVCVLIQEKNFESAGGLEEVTREMKLMIMAQAALLLTGRPHRYFPRLRSVILYPDAYRDSKSDEDGVDGVKGSVRLGESWGHGSIVLSYRSVEMGGKDPKDGQNVVLHEFAHQLDQETGWGDGVPVLAERGDYRTWAKAFSMAYEELQEDVETGRRTVLDDYGATNPAEFFAVATETFFEKGEQLREAKPAIYEQLKLYYGMDPAEWARVETAR